MTNFTVSMTRGTRPADPDERHRGTSGSGHCPLPIFPVDKNAPSCGSGGYARCGIGWYRKRFALSQDPNELYSLYFEGVYMNCNLWVNGQYAGGHIYGYTSFEKDVTPYLKQGENELLLRVDNSHQPGSRWYTGSGITRNVYLIRHQRLYVRTWGCKLPHRKSICQKPRWKSVRTCGAD